MLLRSKSFAKDERGSALVEFAISIMIVLCVVFTILATSLMMYANHFVANAAREGARYAAVRGSSWTDTCSSTIKQNCSATSDSVKNYVKSFSSMQTFSNNLVVNTTWPGTDATGTSLSSLSQCGSALDAHSPGCVVVVSVTYSSQLISLPLIPVIPSILTSSSAMTITY